ncbi:MAG: molybdopterin-dependent oxidoreductase [Halioglobus sp.]|nr:molybdopterin-dependent oxidoreductase [Halioglobus sp.]
MSDLKDTVNNSTDGAWSDKYRDKWTWDKVTWGTHCVDCYPGNCPFRVFTKDGKIVREEQGSTFTNIEPGVPDMNPMGCQKGVAWSRMIDGDDRVKYPLRRSGERGEGQWTQVSWDEATTEIADAMLDAMEESGPGAILRPGSTEGGSQTIAMANLFFMHLGACVSDVLAEVGDMNPGLYTTYGRLGQCSSHDDWFHSEYILIWGNNPAQSNIATFHYISEARYNGSEIVTIAPDYSPSAVHADRYVPVKPGSDAALALSICQVIIEEGLVNEDFIREQTDLAMLVRKDSARFLRKSDLQEDGAENAFYFFDTQSQQITEAPPTLELAGVVPALEGTFEVTLKDGGVVEVEPAIVRLRRHLESYKPEKATATCAVHPDLIREMARKAASKRTRIITGWTFCKSYHGDLIERALTLIVGLTGNWGKQGAGVRGIGAGMFDGLYLQSIKPELNQDVTQQIKDAGEELFQAALAKDPTLTREIFMFEAASEGGFKTGSSPPFFFWYNQCGFDEVYNKPSHKDATMKRNFDEYVNEALEKGWWAGLDHPKKEEPHRVLFNIGANLLRMQRGGQRMLLDKLWPSLDMVVTMDFRLSTTALYSDFVLPMAQHHEKVNTNYSVHDTMMLAFGDKAVEPQGEALSEFQAMILIARKLTERAKARGMLEVKTHEGRTVKLDTFYDDLTHNGALADDEVFMDQAFRDSAVMQTMPPGTSLDTMREKGWVRYTGLGTGPTSLAQASEIRPDETFAPFRWQTEKKEPYPTLTRRAQYYIDHEWFLEAGEEFPTHKDAPPMGGDHPFVITSGHPRAGVNGMHSTDKTMMQTTRGEPVAHINDEDAAARGIANGGKMRLFNDDSSIVIQAKVTPAVRPGSVVLYTGFESYLSPEWKDLATLETGMVKWLHMAGGYGHLSYRPLMWQPVPIDRGVRVDYEKMA